MKILNEPIDWHLSIGHETNKRIKVEKNKSNTYLITLVPTVFPRSPSMGPKATEAISTKAADAIWLRAVDNSTARNTSMNSGVTGGVQRAKQWGQGPGPVVGPVWVGQVIGVAIRFLTYRQLEI